MGDLQILRADPRDKRVRDLVERHLIFGRSFTPLEGAHALEVDELLDPAIVPFAARDGEEILAVGALNYEGACFTPCQPVGDYRRSPHSVYLAISL